MKNNAFAQVHRAFYSLIAPNKSTPTRGASAWWERSERNVAALLHPKAQRRRQAVERMHQAVERRHALPKRRGDTARPTQGDRRKPRERRRSPKRRQVGGAGKSSVLHPKAQRGRQAVEHVHQAVERRHALPQAKGRHRATDPRRPEEAP